MMDLDDEEETTEVAPPPTAAIAAAWAARLDRNHDALWNARRRLADDQARAIEAMNEPKEGSEDK